MLYFQTFSQTPIAVVSLVDFGRQWFKSIQGLPVESTPRCVAFCAHVVKRKAKDGVMVVPDATKDDRFKDNPLVAGGPKIRFYAGAALLSPEGARLGSLCVIDYEPHPDFTLKQKEMLESFAAQAVLQMISR
jgi:GAF domain-containing protein